MKLAIVLAPFVLQAALMGYDELVHHRRRGLPRWERVGHPLDTLTACACYAWLLAVRPSQAHAAIYGALAIGSSLFVTKDEKVHATRCSAAEHWTHAVLFLLHPIVLLVAGWLWWAHTFMPLIAIELALAIGLASYQILYWNGPWRHAR